MHANWWITGLSYVEIAGQIAVLIALARNRLIGRWASIFTACLSNLLIYTALELFLHWPHHYTPYFYTYWAGVAVQYAIRLWLAADILRSVPGAYSASRRSDHLLAVIAVALSAIAWAITMRDGVNMVPGAAATAVLYDRCANVAWAVFLSFVMVAVALKRLGWEPHGAYITRGIMFHIICRVLVSLMASFGTHSILAFQDGFDSATYIAVLVYWTACFSLNLPQPSTNPQQDPATEEIQSGILKVLCKQRGMGTS
jgi:hypothetical protein